MKLPSLLILLLALATPLSAELAGTKPNVVLVITDDQGYPPIAAHGHPWVKTPNLDTLHDGSTRFTRFLVAPTCSPTRSAIMTGRHPEKNGITHTILERERMTLDATILPQVLKTAGYTSGIFGKWHLGGDEPNISRKNAVSMKSSSTGRAASDRPTTAPAPTRRRTNTTTP